MLGTHPVRVKPGTPGFTRAGSALRSTRRMLLLPLALALFISLARREGHKASVSDPNVRRRIENPSTSGAAAASTYGNQLAVTAFV